MKTVTIALILSVFLVFSMSQIASAIGPQETLTTVAAVEASTTSLPIWGYGILGVNLLIAGLLAAFPFLVKDR